MKNLQSFFKNLYLGFRFAKILSKRRNYIDLKASGDAMRKPKQWKYTEYERKMADAQRQVSPEQLAVWQSNPWNSLANSQQAINLNEQIKKRLK